MEQQIALWADLMDACNGLLLAGFRRRASSHDAVMAAYRKWRALRTQERDQTTLSLLRGFDRRG